ncbi:MAG: ribonuclease H-like domain-containing protein, partial [Lachnospiraceae bacterium]|nr:ribonuclease H-like domain-containing protein [Lachnospiraceae bacterium]
MKTIKAKIDHPKFTYDFPQKKEEILFFDIETTGLSPKTSSIYLIGVLFYEKSTEDFIQVQWFAEKNKDEKMVLSSFLELLNHYKYLYHFNGRTFDIPYILEKCKRHALLLNEHADKILNDTTGVFSIDILKRVRKLKRFLSLEKCSQKALERFLGIYREDKFSGGDLITVYSEYTQMRLFEPEKAEALEKVLLLHNFEDVEMMLSVCSLLQYEALTFENSPFFSEAALKQMTFETADSQVSSVCSGPGSGRQSEKVLHLSLPAVLPFPTEIKK